MSDELTPGPRYEDRYEDEGLGAGSGRSELATALRELAQEHETPVAVPGAEIRRRAVRRRRRRKASLAAAGAAGAGALALVLAVVFTGGEDSRSVPPAAGYGAQTPPTTAGPSAAAPVAATVNLTKRELTAEGRTLPISAGTIKSPTPTGLMKVTAKYETTVVPRELAGWSAYDVKATWVMRLRGPDDRTNYLFALNQDEKAPGNYDSTGGAIGLRSRDAMWLYEELKLGAVVQVVGVTQTQRAPDVTSSATTPENSATLEEATGVDPGAAASVPTASPPATPSSVGRTGGQSPGASFTAR
ncbi:L,D-transpeptidase [Streptomyces sp. NPDC048484]|uniref:L,D-transpeptidase n=1 Tax=Streptomyces sp. NPDC048484 TaxID=3155146 RepID=UPI00342341CB